MRFKGRALVLGAMLLATTGLGGCVTGVKSSEYSRSDVGQVVQVEACVVLSQRPVVISSWVPFGMGPGANKRTSRDRVSRQRRGIAYVIKLERTGETLSVTQADDVTIPNGAQAWVEFGARVRLSPR
jgi:hypothetical protein